MDGFDLGPWPPWHRAHALFQQRSLGFSGYFAVDQSDLSSLQANLRGKSGNEGMEESSRPQVKQLWNPKALLEGSAGLVSHDSFGGSEAPVRRPGSSLAQTLEEPLVAVSAASVVEADSSTSAAHFGSADQVFARQGRLPVQRTRMASSPRAEEPHEDSWRSGMSLFLARLAKPL